jgi:hypothetical protein
MGVEVARLAARPANKSRARTDSARYLHSGIRASRQGRSMWLLIHHSQQGTDEGVGWVFGLGLTLNYRLALRLPFK